MSQLNVSFSERLCPIMGAARTLQKESNIKY